MTRRAKQRSRSTGQAQDGAGLKPVSYQLACLWMSRLCGILPANYNEIMRSTGWSERRAKFRSNVCVHHGLLRVENGRLHRGEMAPCEVERSAAEWRPAGRRGSNKWRKR